MPSNSETILLVDDDPGLLRLLSIRLEGAGYEVLTAPDAASALNIVDTLKIDAVITDLRMEGMNGMELLKVIGQRMPSLPVTVLTAHGTIPDAVQAVQSGAFGFLTKPVDKKELLTLLERALPHHYRQPEETWRSRIITRNAQMEELLGEVKMVAHSDASVLITGESGTGKELIARAIHEASPRSSRPFQAINCGAIPENLLESELFGHEKGAFTGAVRPYPGQIAAADGGSLLLDEIGDMPLALQVKLLRALQERKFRRLGATRDTAVDVRILSATHRDLREAIACREFREDLFYRLNVVSLHIPPLRERREDIPLLASHFLEQLAGPGQDRKRFAPDAIALLVAADWPGNIRQLANVVEQTAALSKRSIITEALVDKALGNQPGSLPSYAEARERFTRRYLAQLLEATGGNVSQAARIARRNRTDFYKLLQRHNISPARFKSAGS